MLIATETGMTQVHLTDSSAMATASLSAAGLSENVSILACCFCIPVYNKMYVGEKC